MNSVVIGLLVGFGVVAVFLAIRELNCWYWKVHDRVELLREIRDLLQELKNRQNP